MPSKSQKQHDLMVIVAADKDFAEKTGIDQAVAREFLKEDEELGLWQKVPAEDMKPDTEKTKTHPRAT